MVCLLTCTIHDQNVPDSGVFSLNFPISFFELWNYSLLARSWGYNKEEKGELNSNWEIDSIESVRRSCGRVETLQVAVTVLQKKCLCSFLTIHPPELRADSTTGWAVWAAKQHQRTATAPGVIVFVTLLQFWYSWGNMDEDEVHSRLRNDFLSSIGDPHFKDGCIFCKIAQGKEPKAKILFQVRFYFLLDLTWELRLESSLDSSLADCTRCISGLNVYLPQDQEPHVTRHRENV